MSKANFSWHSNNRFELLVDSWQFFPQMLTAIRSARSTIYLEQYLVESGSVLNEFINALLQAANNGVTIFILLDDYGAKHMSEFDRNRLRTVGIKLEFYNPFKWSKLYNSMRRNHRKLLLVDNRIAFVGGACISDEYRIETMPSTSWHDIVIRIEGDVVKDWYQSFIAMWEKTTKTAITDNIFIDSIPSMQRGRIALANGFGKNQIIRHTIARIKKSRNIIWIATPYFVITHKLRRSLSRAAKLGVDVRVLLPGDITDHPWISHASRHYYARLLKSNIRIYEYQPRFIHAKLIICDDWVSLGSSNLDRWNHYWNLDANQEVLDTKFANQVRQLFEQDFLQSNVIDVNSWQDRPVHRRLTEWWSAYKIRIIQWLTFYAERIKKKKAD